MTISRQHSNTQITEILGKTCEKILAVTGDSDDLIIVFYVLIEGVWLRMYLDAGLLFADECQGPDSDDDLNDGQEYLDLAEKFGCAGSFISLAVMNRGVFTLGLANGLRMHFVERDEGTFLIVEN